MSERRSPLDEAHRRRNGKMVEFAGWRLPVQYTGVLDEHRAVRGAAGLFDVSHMGEFRVAGAGAEAFLDRMTPNHVAKLRPGRAHYTGLLTERGTYVDDLLIYRLDEAEFLLVVNAARAAADLAWLREHAESHGGPQVGIEDRSDRYALLALQGPKSAEILARLCDDEVASIRYYRFRRGTVAGREAIVSRTGYTGEDGFELYLEPEGAEAVWEALLDAGRDDGLVPAGLGARDTLRLEAGMALYGHELDETTTPFEAGLDWVVKLGKGDFVGREALAAQAEGGPERRLAGFEVRDRGIARHGYEVVHEGRAVGAVTSGTWSPTLERAIGMAYLPTALAAPGTVIEVVVRGRGLAAEVVELPFYRRSE